MAIILMAKYEKVESVSIATIVHAIGLLIILYTRRPYKGPFSLQRVGLFNVVC